MKKAFYIIFFFSIASIVVAFATPEKKVEKLVSKIWKGQEITLNEVELPDSLKKEFQQFKSITVDSKHEGYAIYTTSFGCRIGGCAAPKNANALSYETFDYIVVYDRDLNIIKVDIANYGGDYGYEICNPKWLKQFIGAGLGFELNENVDGIAGATVSATYLIEDLNHVGETVRTLLKPDYTKL